jgi:hypothetical protein
LVDSITIVISKIKINAIFINRISVPSSYEVVFSGLKLAFGIKFWSLKVGCPLKGICDTKVLMFDGPVSFPTCATLTFFANGRQIHYVRK